MGLKYLKRAPLIKRPRTESSRGPFSSLGNCIPSKVRNEFALISDSCCDSPSMRRDGLNIKLHVDLLLNISSIFRWRDALRDLYYALYYVLQHGRARHV